MFDPTPPVADSRLEALIELFFTPRPSAPTPRDTELASTGQRLALKAGLAAWSWGRSEGAPTVLLVHGWESRGTHWGGFINALVEAGFRAVSIDAPAHGESPGLQTNGLEYGRKLIEIGDELGPFAGIVGHSFGVAAIVIGLDRGLKADRVALIAGPSSLASFVDAWGTQKGINSDEMPKFSALVDQKIGEPIAEFDIPGTAPRMTVPALIVHDRDDPEIPLEHAEEVARAWPGSTLLITEKLGHRRVLISRKVIQAVVEYFEEGRKLPRQPRSTPPPPLWRASSF